MGATIQRPVTTNKTTPLGMKTSLSSRLRQRPGRRQPLIILTPPCEAYHSVRCRKNRSKYRQLLDFRASVDSLAILLRLLLLHTAVFSRCINLPPTCLVPSKHLRAPQSPRRLLQPKASRKKSTVTSPSQHRVNHVEQVDEELPSPLHLLRRTRSKAVMKPWKSPLRCQNVAQGQGLPLLLLSYRAVHRLTSRLHPLDHALDNPSPHFLRWKNKTRSLAFRNSQYQRRLVQRYRRRVVSVVLAERPPSCRQLKQTTIQPHRRNRCRNSSQFLID